MATTLEQRRMLAGYAATEGIPATRRREWRTVVMPFGTNVQRDGLLQAIAFLERTARSPELNEARDTLLRAVKNHLFDQHFLTPRPARPGFVGVDRQATLIRIVAALDATEYMLVTREVLAVSVWLKRATQALCGDA